MGSFGSTFVVVHELHGIFMVQLKNLWVWAPDFVPIFIVIVFISVFMYRISSYINIMGLFITLVFLDLDFLRKGHGFLGRH